MIPGIHFGVQALSSFSKGVQGFLLNYKKWGLSWNRVVIGKLVQEKFLSEQQQAE